MGFIDRMKTEARAKMLKLVLPEGKDSRIISAAKILIDENLVSEVALIGNEDEIKKVADGAGVKLVDRIVLINPSKSPKLEEYAKEYFELRKNKGITLDQAREDI
ncbi:MAG: phosphate acyltransferase, partial [Spirochaetaceae bacterium]|nr:phosphate acyltransferase [Spirochaetaceae bacterium]